MRANELRLGNYVYDRAEKVLRIDFFEYIDADYNFKFGQKMYVQDIEVHPLTEYILYSKPIPLTEEWLLKFGFSKMTDTTPYNYRIHKSKMFFYIRYGTFTTDGGKTDLIGFNGLFIANKFVRVIKHVHQLQNLYFALTGEELTLQES